MKTFRSRSLLARLGENVKQIAHLGFSTKFNKLILEWGSNIVGYLIPLLLHENGYMLVHVDGSMYDIVKFV